MTEQMVLMLFMIGVLLLVVAARNKILRHNLPVTSVNYLES